MAFGLLANVVVVYNLQMATLRTFNCPFHCDDTEFSIDQTAVQSHGLRIVKEGKFKILTKDGNPLAVYCVNHLMPFLTKKGPPETYHENGKQGRMHDGAVQAFVDVPEELRAKNVIRPRHTKS